MATLAMPMSAVPASIQDLPIPIEDLQAQVNELSAQKQEVPAAIQESSATVQDVHKLTEEKSNSNRATTTPTEETTSSAEETPTLTAEKIDLAEGNTVSTDDTLAQVQEIPIAVQVPAKHDVETATAALDTSLDSLPPPKVAVPAINHLRHTSSLTITPECRTCPKRLTGTSLSTGLSRTKRPARNLLVRVSRVSLAYISRKHWMIGSISPADY